MSPDQRKKINTEACTRLNNRKIVSYNDEEITVACNDIKYTCKLDSGFEIEILNDIIKSMINKRMEIFKGRDQRSADLGRKFSDNLNRGYITWGEYKWLNSHCYTNNEKSWLTTGRFTYEVEYILFGFPLSEKVQGQLNKSPIVCTNKQIFDMISKKIQDKFASTSNYVNLP